jgi:hypothetical protein
MLERNNQEGGRGAGAGSTPEGPVRQCRTVLGASGVCDEGLAERAYSPGENTGGCSVAVCVGGGLGRFCVRGGKSSCTCFSVG